MDYTGIVPKRISDIKPSGIRKFFDILVEMDDVISLTVGEPDFVTPRHIRDAAIQSLEKGKTYYTGNSGLPALRESIAAYLERRFSLKYDPKSEVIVTVGGSEAIDMAVRAVVDTDDEVIIPQPSFVCYGPIVELAHGKPVFVETRAEDNFKLTPEALKAAITPKTKMIVL
ncbi:MAG: aminotransferase class I/II-fold pyridoxal phosphate-dependent enzyme, partial [Clostridia bacterium]|nr:aminotransferase class I/II-fold pyridoxal phosphate-dependent enzyme [Clostridia bacterium]